MRELNHACCPEVTHRNSSVNAQRVPGEVNMTSHFMVLVEGLSCRGFQLPLQN